MHMQSIKSKLTRIDRMLSDQLKHADPFPKHPLGHGDLQHLCGILVVVIVG